MADADSFGAQVDALMTIKNPVVKAALVDVHFKKNSANRVAVAKQALASKKIPLLRAAIKGLANESAGTEMLKDLWQKRDDELLKAVHLDLYNAMLSSEIDSLKLIATEFGSDLKNIHSIVLEGGDSLKGKKVFEGVGACMQCHSIKKKGGDQGPTLDSIGLHQDRSILLESLVAPSQKIAKGYGTMTIETNEGEIYSGRLAGENKKELTIVLATGKK